jgi:hypothetical protein
MPDAFVRHMEAAAKPTGGLDGRRRSLRTLWRHLFCKTPYARPELPAATPYQAKGVRLSRYKRCAVWGVRCCRLYQKDDGIFFGKNLFTRQRSANIGGTAPLT